MKKKKNSMLIRFILLVILIIIVVVMIFVIMARYENTATTIGEINVAVYVVETDYQTMDVKLDNMVPRLLPYTYTFSVSNFDEEKRTDVEIEYKIIIRATTNLPLIYELYMGESYDDPGAKNLLQGSLEIIQDEDDTFFIILTAPPEFFGYEYDETNVYQLVVYFPETYESISYKGAEYQDLIENIEINVNSKQVLPEDEEPEEEEE